MYFIKRLGMFLLFRLSYFRIWDLEFGSLSRLKILGCMVVKLLGLGVEVYMNENWGKFLDLYWVLEEVVFLFMEWLFMVKDVSIECCGDFLYFKDVDEIKFLGWWFFLGKWWNMRMCLYNWYVWILKFVREWENVFWWIG